MLFGRYHVVIFRENGGTSRSLRFSGWLGWLLVLLVTGLTVLSLWLWKFYPRAQELEARLTEAEHTLEARQSSLSLLADELAAVRADLLRVRQFDAKLRLMFKEDAGISDLMMAQNDDNDPGYMPMHRYELTARKMRALLKELEQETRLEELTQQELLMAMRDNRTRLAMTPSIWPTEGFVTSKFGPRRSPFTGKSSFHKGLDIGAPTGTPIYAPARGTVNSAGRERAYGLCVDLDHGGGLTTRFAHMSKFVVKPGQQVERGQIIGYVGSTGRVTGPHLHYEVRINGVPTDPYAYIMN